ncbi:fatty acid desaturase family protein [Pontibacter silvestris]|uniref:Fatty acid desaturase family protein n=1 Tax=Pontibacter silvestris TaxID=2305183 RepID=A0ABW4WUS9_9BACT|nr:acyl-CoA desaturase [Pontibacter silvestris]MCC9138978.1 acyl-CoA desaturase [Pontibacter silvestris]
MSPKVKFINTQQSGFFSTVRSRVDAYLKEKGVSKYANQAMWRKTIFYLTLSLGIYLLILSGRFGVWTMFGLSLLLGICCALIGFNIGHDAIHGSFSASRKVNKALSFTFNLIGASPYVWSLTHNIVHHTYTNIPGHDEDIEVAPGLIRLHPDDKLNKVQRFQHLYAFGLYSLSSLSWVLRKDYVKFFQKKIGQHPTLNHPRREYFNLFFYKAIYYFLFMVLPLLVLQITWWQFVIGFVGMHLAEGLVMGLVFQLAHVVEGTDFPLPNEKGNMEEAWADHQMRTTANFATRSRLAGFLLGGLNQQIEHHLFPKVCHIHYPAISGIVRQTAQEFGLPYIENPTFFKALQSHYRMLKKFGLHACQLQQIQRRPEAYKATAGKQKSLTFK